MSGGYSRRQGRRRSKSPCGLFVGHVLQESLSLEDTLDSSSFWVGRHLDEELIYDNLEFGCVGLLGSLRALGFMKDFFTPPWKLLHQGSFDKILQIAKN